MGVLGERVGRKFRGWSWFWGGCFRSRGGFWNGIFEGLIDESGDSLAEFADVERRG